MNMDEVNTPKASKSRWPKPGQLVIGILFITLGLIWLFAQFMGNWFITDFWPLFLVVGGLIFYAAFFLRSERPPGYEGLLFPGTYLIVLGVLFIMMNLIGWASIRYLWPTFLLGVAISLGSMYKLGSRDNAIQKKDLLSAMKVITIISIILYLLAIGGFRIWPLILIFIGIIVLYRGLRNRTKHKHINEE